MRIKVQLLLDSGELIEEKDFTHMPGRAFDDNNSITISGMILLAIKYLANLGPY